MTEVLQLFSSDNRPLYLEDCLDMLALPTGAVHRFRYNSDYVWMGENQDPSDKRTTWSELVGSDVTVHFVAAKSLQYGQVVFVPLRAGKVVAAFVEGNTFVVDFAVGHYLNPRTYLRDADGDNLPLDAFKVSDKYEPTFEARQAAVVQATTAIAKSLNGKHPELKAQMGGVSAVLKSSSTGYAWRDDGDDASETFERLITVLHDLVGVHKQPGQHAYGAFRSFFRVVGVFDSKGKEQVVSGGQYVLRSGGRYELRTLHLNLAGLGADYVDIVVPPPLELIGPSSITINGKYDVREFKLEAPSRESAAIGVLQLSNSVYEDDCYATPDDAARVEVQLPIRSIPRRLFTGLSWAVVVGAAFAGVALALNGLSAIEVQLPAAPHRPLYWDLSSCFGFGGYVGVALGAIVPAVATGLVSGFLAAATLFRRRWGLSDSK